MGMRKFPSTAGTDGIRKKKTMITPWTVNSLLYVSEMNQVFVGWMSSMRRSTAASPPTAKKNVIEIRYRIAIRLWSVVRSHDLTP